MTELSQMSQEGGNTRPPPSSRARCRRWCFTLNNPGPEDLSHLSRDFNKLGAKWIIGEEVGAEGTPHLQGYVEFKNQTSWSTIKRLSTRAHWEKAKGNQQQNVRYCSKEGNYQGNLEIVLDRKERLLAKYNEVIWQPWQEEIILLASEDPHPRKVYWFWEPNGNVGKSFLARYLHLKFSAIIAKGKTSDIAFQLKSWLDANPSEDAPKFCLIDVPRTNGNTVNYNAIEELKNGLLVSGKYESCACVFGAMHVIVFANTEPITYNLSQDRWIIRRI